MIEQWVSQDEAEHFRTIRDRILCNEKRAGRMLAIDQQILSNQNNSDGVATDNSREQIELQIQWFSR